MPYPASLTRALTRKCPAEGSGNSRSVGAPRRVLVLELLDILLMQSCSFRPSVNDGTSFALGHDLRMQWAGCCAARGAEFVGQRQVLKTLESCRMRVTVCEDSRRQGVVWTGSKQVAAMLAVRSLLASANC